MRIADLTPRQREIADLIIKGFHGQNELAEKTGLSTSSASTHRTLALRSLGLETDLQLLALAVTEALAECRQRLAAGHESPLAPLEFVYQVLP